MIPPYHQIILYVLEKDFLKKSFKINIYKNITKFYYQTKDEKLQCNIIREASKTPALSSVKNDKSEYLTRGAILPSNQKQITTQAKFTYSLLGKAFEKQTKTTEDQKKSQPKKILN